MNILVFGGTGFLGKAVVEKLVEANHNLILFTRKSNTQQTNTDSISYISGDLNDITQILNQAKQFNPDILINLIGIIKEDRAKNITFENTHYEINVKLIDLAKQLNINHYIYISANAIENINTGYAISKLKAEEYIKKSGLNYTIFRPSLILDKSTDYNFAIVISDLIKFSIVPIIGKGNYQFSPVYRWDVAQAVLNSLDNKNTQNKTIVLASDEIIQFKDLIKKAVDIRKYKRFYIRIPEFIIDLATKVLDPLKLLPITNDQYKMLKAGNLNNAKSYWKELNIIPKSIDEMMNLIYSDN